MRDGPDYQNLETDLGLAIQSGLAGQVRELLDGGADVHGCDGRGDSWLHWAAGEGHYEIVLMMLLRGADPNVQNNRGKTPLHYATWESRTSISRLLLEHGAKAGIKDDDGETPLSITRANFARLHDAQPQTGRVPGMRDGGTEVIQDSFMFSERPDYKGADAEELRHAYEALLKAGGANDHKLLADRFASLLKDCPESGPVHRGYAWALFRASPGGDSNLALAHLGRALDLNPQDAEAHLFRGQILSWSDEEKAAECWSDALNGRLLRCWATTAAGRLGIHLVKQGDGFRALRWLEFARDHSTDSYESLAALAYVYFRRGHAAAADATLAKAESFNWQQVELSQTLIAQIFELRFV